MHARLMSVCIRLTAIIILQLLNKQVYSQSPVYKNYTVNDGLPSQVVYCALQDKLGYMWFGTDAGVSRFDGRVFQNFTSNSGLSDNEVLKVYQDSQERIWFLMLNGTVSYYLMGQIYSGANDLSLANIKTKRELMSFYEDDNKNIWIGSASGELVLIPNKGKPRIIDLGTLENQSSSRLVYVFEDGINLLVLVGSSMFSMSNFQFELVDTSCYVAKNSPFIVVDKLDDKSFAVSYKNGIRKYNNGTSELIIKKDDINNYQALQRMFVDRNNGVWLITSDLRTDLYGMTDSGFNLIESYLPGIYVGAVYLDREGNKWFCTIGIGLLKLSKDHSNTEIIGEDVLLKDKEIWSVNVDKFDRVWFGSGNRVLYHFKMDSAVLKIDIGSERNRIGRVTRIEFDSSGSIWCSASTGVVRIVPDKMKHYKIEYVKTLANLSNFNAKYVRFNQEKQLCFSSFRGIQKVYLRGNQFVYSPYIPEKLDVPSRVYCLYFDKNNRLWFENFNMLISYNGDSIKRYHDLATKFKSQISSIEGFDDSTLVISTYGNGVHFFRNGRIINQISAKNGLAGDLCRKLFIDSNTVYVATNQGFSFFRYINNSISDIRTITTSDGIVSNDIKDICVRGENIYLATSGGLCIVKKDIVQTTADPPPLYFISVSSRGTEIQELANLKFPYKADFSLNYIAITFDQPDKVTYQYNVTGEESDWIETRNSSIAFSSLSPGDYTFRLRAKKFNSDWSNMASLQFTIVPPLWQQWWFSLLIFLCLAAATYFLLRSMAESRFKTQLGILKEKQMLADERSRIAADMHDDLGADLSNLLLMNRMAGKERPERMTIDSQSSRFEAHIHEIILKVDEIIWALNPRNDTLNGTIEFMRNYVVKISQLIGVKSVVEMPQSLPVVPVSANFRRNLFLVLKEALNNIYHHSEANMLNLTFKIMANDLHLLIGDNGKGFDVKPGQPGADGLINMQKRIQELGGKFSISSRIGAGSEIKIIVPFC